MIAKPEAHASGFPIAVTVSPQCFTHRGAGVCFTDGIEVAVDVGGSAHVAVAEPFLDLFHGYALGKEHRGAGRGSVFSSNYALT